MRIGARARLRRLRYAVPGMIERHFPGPGAAAAVARCAGLRRSGMAASIGYFQASGDAPETIVRAYEEAAAGLAGSGACLAVKAPPLRFDPGHVGRIAGAAAAAGLTLCFDSHAPKDAERTLDLAAATLLHQPGTGIVLPARWRRSAGDAERFRESAARIRIVKGEWADVPASQQDVAARFLALVSALAGRAAAVAVATHDPVLAERALAILIAAGTPCELEQLRGLPRRRTLAVARRLGVPVRVYVPFGPGWWPYAVDKALARPYLPLWMVHDRLGIGGPGRRNPVTAAPRHPASSR